jgi:hypothetical protein
MDTTNIFGLNFFSLENIIFLKFPLVFYLLPEAESICNILPAAF